MKIKYAQNPLYSSVTLSKLEKKIFVQSVELEYLSELYYDVYCTVLYDGDLKSIKESFSNEFINDQESYEKMVQKRAEMLMQEIIFGSSHFGDCVAHSCSCIKCIAESHLGIDTIAGMSKSLGCFLSNSKIIDDTTSIDKIIDEAKIKNIDEVDINWLINYKKNMLKC